MRHQRDKRLLISIQDDQDHLPVLVYDLERLCIDDDLTAYGLYLARVRLLDEKTVRGAIYQVARFVSYMGEIGAEVSDISDAVLVIYRDKLNEQAPKRAKGVRKRAYLATVNAALSDVYDWIWWLQKSGRSDDMTIGPFPCRVTSEQVVHGRGSSWSKPLIRHGSGKGSWQKLPGFVPDQKARERVLEKMHSAPSGYCGLRNALMQRIAEAVGIRRASICSLQIEPFDRDKLDESEFEKVDVTPPVQKFRYDDSFAFPLGLAYEIASFVEGPRSELMESLGVDESISECAVFLSERTGTPLLPGSVTKIFATAMRAAGAPRGAAVHAWRHKRAQDTADNEIAYRLAMGMDVSDAAVAGAIMITLGHKNPRSVMTYIASSHAKRRLRARQAQRGR